MLKKLFVDIVILAQYWNNPNASLKWDNEMDNEKYFSSIYLSIYPSRFIMKQKFACGPLSFKVTSFVFALKANNPLPNVFWMGPIRLQWHDIYSGRTYFKTRMRGLADLTLDLRMRKICDKFDVWHHPYSKSTFTCSNCWTSNTSSTNARIWFGNCVKDRSSRRSKQTNYYTCPPVSM